MIKLLIYGIANRGGGSETFLYNFVKNILLSKRFDIHLFVAISRRHIYAEFETNLSIKYIEDKYIVSPMKRILYENSTICKYVKIHKFDLIFIPSEVIPFNWNRLGVPIVTNVHSTLQSSSQKRLFSKTLKENYEYYMRKRSFRYSAKIVFVSHLSKAEICYKYNINERKVAVIYHGVDSKMFDSNKIDNGYLLSVGDRHSHKNYNQLIRLFSLCKHKYLNDEKLIIVGRPISKKVEKSINDQILKSGYSDSIILTDNIDNSEMPRFFMGAKAYVSFSTWESFGLTPLEAMASKVPVLLYWNSALPEIYNNNVYYINPYIDSEESQVDKLYRILKNPTLREDLITKGYIFAQSMSWEKSVAQYICVFEQIYSLGK